MRTTKIVAIEALPDNAILAEDLRDNKGQCLLTAKAQLTASAVQLLRRRGITMVPIEEENTLGPEQISAVRQQIEAELAQRFRSHEADPCMQELKQILLDYRLNEV